MRKKRVPTRINRNTEHNSGSNDSNESDSRRTVCGTYTISVTNRGPTLAVFRLPRTATTALTDISGGALRFWLGWRNAYRSLRVCACIFWNSVRYGTDAKQRTRRRNSDRTVLNWLRGHREFRWGRGNDTKSNWNRFENGPESMLRRSFGFRFLSPNGF